MADRDQGLGRAGLRQAGTPATGDQGPWPGFGSAPPGVADAGATGSSAQAARSDHTHASSTIFADSVNTSGTKLSSINASALPKGSIAYVSTVGDQFALRQSGQTVDHLNVETANGRPGFQWVRLGLSDRANQAVTAWSVDPANSSGLAFDENTGADDLHPLLTMTECFNRIRQSNGQSIAIHLMSSMNPATDRPTSYYVPAAGTFNVITITGALTVIFSSVLTGATAAAATPTTTENSVTDAALPGGTWTAAGALVAGRLLQRTSGLAGFARVLRDEGANTAMTSFLYDVVGETFPAWANGDHYSLVQLPIIGDIVNAGNPYTSVGDPNIKVVNCDYRGTGQSSPLWFQNCTHSSGAFAMGGLYEAVHFNTTVLFRPGYSNTSITFIGGSFQGTGSRQYTVVGPARGVDVIGPVVFEGAELIVSTGTFLVTNFSADNKGGLYFYDVTGSRCILCIYWSNVLFFQGAIGGNRNTGALMNADQESQIMNGTGITPPYLDASTSNATKFILDGNHVTADYPVNHMSTTMNAIADTG